MNSPVRIALFLVLLVSLAGCGGEVGDGPPVVRLGETVCDQCNMIISDERWATATIVDGPRGPEARLFDDFNCQVAHEAEHPDQKVHARWSHSHATNEWQRTEEATFLSSPSLRTPMGSGFAAFGSRAEAEAAQAELTGDVMSFDAAWTRLGASEDSESATGG